MPRRHDLALGPLLILLGALAFVLLGAVIILESFLLRLLRWSSPARCLLDAALANLISTVLGLLAFLALEDHLGDLFAPWGILLMLGLTILVEAGVLALRRPPGAPPVLRTAAIVNVPSYLALWIILGLVT